MVAKKFTMFIGLNYGEGKTHDPHYATKVIVDALKRYGIAGATFYGAQGLWEGNMEETIIVSILSTQDSPVSPARVHSCAIMIKRLLEQETVMVETSEVGVLFV